MLIYICIKCNACGELKKGNVCFPHIVEGEASKKCCNENMFYGIVTNSGDSNTKSLALCKAVIQLKLPKLAEFAIFL